MIITKSYINVPGVTMQCSKSSKNISFNDFSDIKVWKYVKVIIIKFYIELLKNMEDRKPG